MAETDQKLYRVLAPGADRRVDQDGGRELWSPCIHRQVLPNLQVAAAACDGDRRRDAPPESPGPQAGRAYRAFGDRGASSGSGRTRSLSLWR